MIILLVEDVWPFACSIRFTLEDFKCCQTRNQLLSHRINVASVSPSDLRPLISAAFAGIPLFSFSREEGNRGRDPILAYPSFFVALNLSLPILRDPEPTEMRDLDRYIEQLMRCEYLKESEVKALCARAREVFLDESNVQSVQAPVTVSLFCDM